VPPQTAVVPINGRLALLARIVPGMTIERGDERRSADPMPADPMPARHATDAAHLDEDAEALEDPVHCGDAKHQHELHEKAHMPGATDPVQRD
jgi:hypothetical protein